MAHYDEIILDAQNMFKKIIKIQEKLKKVELNSLSF